MAAKTIKLYGQEAVEQEAVEQEAAEQETFAKGMRLRNAEECYLVQIPFREGITFQIYLEYAIYPNNPESTDRTGWNYVVNNGKNWEEYSRGSKPYSYSTIQECYDVAMLLVNAYMAGHNQN